MAVGWEREIRVRGVLASAGPALAIVGARAASAAGMRSAHAVARHLSERGVHVVSGGALGIDGAAHRGALAGGGTTTVVLGSGLDVPYPRRHAPLFAQVLAAGGALVSMWPDAQPPRPSLFPQRNRLISALADAVIVIEAELGSGSLSTARAAQAQGRLLAAWPGSPGCDRLLAEGVALVENLEDAELVVGGTPRVRPPIQLPLELDPVVTQVRDAMAAGAIGIDAIVAATGLAVRAVLRALPSIDHSCSARKSRE